ncbi:NucA/NucB deoxyribonuclease domain-containing protein [Micromonospora sp. DT178]|uniref:NucA/NucB deoxyribonuclease domain-containing protein n=1 Tax=Micromonospora sp. DT178 TaxID=3393436 RepID=UPI003CEF1F89
MPSVLAVALAGSPAAAQSPTDSMRGAGQTSYRPAPAKAADSFVPPKDKVGRESSECSKLEKRRDEFLKANKKYFACLDSQNSTNRTRPEHRTGKSMRETLSADASISSIDELQHYCLNDPEEWKTFRDEACHWDLGLNWDIRDARTGALAGEVSLETFHYIFLANGSTNFSEQVWVHSASHWGKGSTAFYDISFTCLGDCRPTTEDGIAPTLATTDADGTWYFVSDLPTESYGRGQTYMQMSMTNADPNVLPGSAFIMSDAKIRCDTLVRHLQVPGCVFPNYVPTVSFSTSGLYPNVAQHIKDAQAAGRPGKPGVRPLHRLIDEYLQKKNRDTACPTSGPNVLPTAPDGSCDEYPFASTQEGAYTGDGVYSRRDVPLIENVAHGRDGVNRDFYVPNRIIHGDAFWVDIDGSGGSGGGPTPPDTQAPIIICPPEVTSTSITPALGQPETSDNADTSVTVTNNAPATFPYGTTIVTWRAVDDSGNEAICAQTVNIRYKFTGFYLGGNYIGDWDQAIQTAPYTLSFSFRVADYADTVISDLSVVTSVTWDASGATIGTPTFNAATGRIELSTWVPKAFNDQTRTLTVSLSDGSRHSVSIEFSTV